MDEIDDAEAKFLKEFRLRLVNEANELRKLHGYAKHWRRISLEVETLIFDSEQSLIKAYQLLPDK